MSKKVLLDLGTAGLPQIEAVPNLIDQLVYEENGFKLDAVQIIDKCLTAQQQKIDADVSARLAFERLLKAGCSVSAISFFFGIMDHLSVLEPVWRKMFRNTKQNSKVVASLKKSLLALEDVVGPIGDIKTQGHNVATVAVPSIEHGVTGMQTCWKVFSTVVEVSTKLEVGSLFELLRYMLTAHVLAITTQAHDAEVSAIISAASTTNECSVANQRMWRNRYFQTINSQMLLLAHIFNGLAIVIDAQRNYLE